MRPSPLSLFFFFNDTATTEIYTLSLHDALPISGSNAIPTYQSLAAWNVGAPYAIGPTAFFNGATLSRITNPNLRWETTVQYDAGVDLGLFGNQLTVTADAYDKTTKDLLYAKQVPYLLGFASYVTNIGSVRNRGLELAVDKIGRAHV